MSQHDGFTYGITWATRPMPYSAYWYGIGQLEILRRVAKDYRVKWVVAPNTLTAATAVTARDTSYYAFSVKPGSYLYGWNFTVGSGDATDFAIRLIDTSSKKTLQNFQISGSFFRAAGEGSNVGTILEVPPVNLLVQPKLISGTGELAVEIASANASNKACQLLLCFAEPRKPDACLPGSVECATN